MRPVLNSFESTQFLSVFINLMAKRIIAMICAKIRLKIKTLVKFQM